MKNCSQNKNVVEITLRKASLSDRHKYFSAGAIHTRSGLGDSANKPRVYATEVARYLEQLVEEGTVIRKYAELGPSTTNLPLYRKKLEEDRD
jgi:hypothetical protein